MPREGIYSRLSTLSCVGVDVNVYSVLNMMVGDRQDCEKHCSWRAEGGRQRILRHYERYQVTRASKANLEGRKL